MISLLVAGVAVALVTALIALSFRPPLVVIKEGSEQTRTFGKFQNVQIDEKVIEKVVKRFIRFRYSWESLSPSQIAKNLSPLTTKGANKKIESRLKKMKIQNFKDKQVKQSITNIHVNVTKEKVVATFDKLLKIEGLPLPVPTQIYLNVIRDSPTYWNPEGLFVNGVIERQSH